MQKWRSSASCCSSNRKSRRMQHTSSDVEVRSARELRPAVAHKSSDCWLWETLRGESVPPRVQTSLAGRRRVTADRWCCGNQPLGLHHFLGASLVASDCCAVHSVECSLSLVANVSSRFIYDFFFFHAHLVSLTQPLHERNPGTQFRPPQLIYSLPGWLRAEAVGGVKLQQGWVVGGQT